MSLPNVLLITSDQHHHQALGVHDTILKSPALDRLVAEGTMFERAYCPNPTCTPTRASIITGLYPSMHGAWSLGTKLAEDVPTVGHQFLAAGYDTSLIGKAHFQPMASTPVQSSLECPERIHDLDFWRGFTGPYYGFDHVELTRGHADEYTAGMHYGVWLEEQGLPDWREYFARRDPNRPNVSPRRHVWDLPEDLHYSTWTADRSMAAIERSVAAERPFFCWASFHDPHPPYLAPEPWATMYDPDDMQPGWLMPGELDRMPVWHQLTQRADPDYSPWQETPYHTHGLVSHLRNEADIRADMAVYYGMVSFLDAQVGRVLDRLDTLGIAGDTVVVFTTDHGHVLGHHGLIKKGAFHYEDLVRIPLLVRYPGHVPSDRRSDAMQSLVDLAPSLLSTIRQDVPGHMQGVNQAPVWTGEQQQARDHVIVESRPQPTAAHLRTYINHRYKLTVYRDQPWGELFDLVDDPAERHNLFDTPAHAALQSALMHEFLNAEMVREPTRFSRIANA